MTQNETEDYLFEGFKLEPSEYGKLTELIKAAYIENSPEEGGTIAFDEEVFKISFGSPALSRDLFARAIHKPTGQVVGFVGAIPRDLSYESKIYKFVIPAWATVHPDHQRKGLTLKMGTKLLEIIKEKEYDGALPLFEPEAHGIDAAKSFERKTGISMKELYMIRKFIIRIFSVKQVAKVVKFKWYEKLVLFLMKGLKKMKNPRIRKFKPEDGERMFELMKDHLEQNQLSLIRDHDDFLWYLKQPIINCVVHEGDDSLVDGFAVAWRFSLSGFGNSVPFGWIDLVHTYRLNLKDASDLFKYLCITSKELGWAGLQCPFLPYFGSKPLKKAKFIFYSKKLLVGLYNFSNVPFPEKVDSFYFEWR